MVKVPRKTTINSKEYIPAPNSIAFAPELIEFISANQKLTTYRFGKKYDYFQVDDLVSYEDSTTGETKGDLRIIGKRETTFADLPLDTATHEAYENKEHQREVLSGYYAFIGRKIADDDLFLVFDFELVK